MNKNNLAWPIMLALMSGCALSDKNLTRAQGAGAGAAVGAGLGALIGDSTKSTLIGAAIGGLIGLAAGEAVARKKADYASTEAMIQEERLIAEKNADDVRAYNDGLRTDLERFDGDISALATKVASERRRHSAALELRDQAEDDLNAARVRLSEVNQEIEASRKLYGEAEQEGPSTELADWEQQIQELERLRDQLVVIISDFEVSAEKISDASGRTHGSIDHSVPGA